MRRGAGKFPCLTWITFSARISSDNRAATRRNSRKIHPSLPLQSSLSPTWNYCFAVAGKTTRLGARSLGRQKCSFDLIKLSYLLPRVESSRKTESQRRSTRARATHIRLVQALLLMEWKGSEKATINDDKSKKHGSPAQSFFFCFFAILWIHISSLFTILWSSLCEEMNFLWHLTERTRGWGRSGQHNRTTQHDPSRSRLRRKNFLPTFDSEDDEKFSGFIK